MLLSFTTFGIHITKLYLYLKFCILPEETLENKGADMGSLSHLEKKRFLIIL